MKTETFKGGGDLNIYFRTWRPEGKKPRAVVVIAHGFNSHGGHYAWTAEQLTTRGLAVYALDHRGRGKSEGERFYVEKIEDYVNDLATFIKLAKTREPGVPVFLLGHSAGGVISCVYALEHQAELTGFICESFALHVYAPDLAVAVLKGLSHIVPHAHVLKLPNAGFSRDPKVVEALNSDPLIADEVQPTLTVAAMVRGNDRVEREFEKITLPVLILHGTLDKVTKPEGSQLFFDRGGSRDKTLKLYDGHFHDLLNDIGKETVLADIQNWLDAHLPTP
jgi:acylglycerol lipase